MLSRAPIRANIPARDIAWARKFYEQTLGRNSLSVGGGAKTAWFNHTEGNILAAGQRL